MRNWIEVRIDEFLSDGDERLDWVRLSVQRHRFLPLYLGWTASFGIRSDGSLVRWEHDESLDSVHELTDEFWRRTALFQGLKRYPELRELIPARPATAVDCHVCKGTGGFLGRPELVCECGGAGWVVPDEVRGLSPG